MDINGMVKKYGPEQPTLASYNKPDISIRFRKRKVKKIQFPERRLLVFKVGKRDAVKGECTFSRSRNEVSFEPLYQLQPGTKYLVTFLAGNIFVEGEDGDSEDASTSTWRHVESFKWYFVTKPTFITTKLKMALYPILGSGAYGNGTFIIINSIVPHIFRVAVYQVPWKGHTVAVKKINNSKYFGTELQNMMLCPESKNLVSPSNLLFIIDPFPSPFK